MSVLANLQAAKSAIALQKNWTQGTLKRNDGRMCALGAIREVRGGDRGTFMSAIDSWPEVKLLAKYGRRNVGKFWEHKNCAAVHLLNDTDGHAAVMEMFDKAIDEARRLSL